MFVYSCWQQTVRLSLAADFGQQLRGLT